MGAIKYERNDMHNVIDFNLIKDISAVATIRPGLQIAIFHEEQDENRYGTPVIQTVVTTYKTIIPTLIRATTSKIVVLAEGHLDENSEFNGDKVRSMFPTDIVYEGTVEEIVSPVPTITPDIQEPAKVERETEKVIADRFRGSKRKGANGIVVLRTETRTDNIEIETYAGNLFASLEQIKRQEHRGIVPHTVRSAKRYPNHSKAAPNKADAVVNAAKAWWIIGNRVYAHVDQPYQMEKLIARFGAKPQFYDEVLSCKSAGDFKDRLYTLSETGRISSPVVCLDFDYDTIDLMAKYGTGRVDCENYRVDKLHSVATTDVRSLALAA